MLNSRTLAVVLAAVLLTQCGAPLPAYGQWRTSVSNVRFQAEQSKVTITYDLAGSQEDEYDVGVTLRKESDKTFKLVPADLQGDAGRGRFAGQHRKITWNLSKELPQGLAGSDYYFEVSAEKTTSNTLFLWIGAGVAAAGGTALVLLLSPHRRPPTNAPVPSAEGFAAPPGRP